MYVFVQGSGLFSLSAVSCAYVDGSAVKLLGLVATLPRLRSGLAGRLLPPSSTCPDKSLYYPHLWLNGRCTEGHHYLCIP